MRTKLKMMEISINTETGDKIYISEDYSKILMSCRENETEFKLITIAQILTQKQEDQCMLSVASFIMNLCEAEIIRYHVEKEQSDMTNLANLLLKFVTQG